MQRKNASEKSALTRVIVIGLDGFAPQIVEPMLASGQLPHLARLRARGGYVRLRTTSPAQTPVAWSTFATGVNPGAHGIFDFLHRNPQTYLPELSFTRYERKNSFLPPRAVNQRRGTAIWELLTEDGFSSTLLRFPCTYPPDPLRGRMLSGMGVPDWRGGLGTSTFFSSARGVKAGEGEQIITVETGAGRAIKTYLIGPRDPRTGADQRFGIAIHLDPARRTAQIVSDGQPSPLTIKVGEWSEWLWVKFKAGLLQSQRAMLRFHLVSLEPHFELYASPLNFDPAAPPFPISSPADYGRELAAAIGTFYTTGMVEDHNGLNNGRISDEAFLAQCEIALAERERMMRHELERFEQGFLYCLFDTPDRVQHMFWRDETEGQLLKPNRAAGVIAEHYRVCDRIVGEALRYADERTLFIALSDHGMNSYERGFNLNTWLHDEGLLALRHGYVPGPEAGNFLRAVDWSRTRAYALGLSGLYLNLEGREERGIVAAGETDSLIAKLAHALTGLGDPQRNRVAVRSTSSREEIYRGAYAWEAPDLLVNYAGGYRVTSASSLGAIHASQFEDNTKKWSGDHLLDPLLVPGVLFMNRPFHGDGASLLDLAPTILSALGAPPRPNMEGASLLR